MSYDTQKHFDLLPLEWIAWLAEHTTVRTIIVIVTTAIFMLPWAWVFWTYYRAQCNWFHARQKAIDEQELLRISLANLIAKQKESKP